MTLSAMLITCERLKSNCAFTYKEAMKNIYKVIAYLLTVANTFELLSIFFRFYPHHYAPYVSDIKDIASMKIEFDYGRPFLPFEQLMAVLPAGSRKLLPLPLQKLMVDPQSPIYDFYPTDFKTDLNGKQQDWEAVVLIPFIDEKRLLENMTPVVENDLSEPERARNTHSSHFQCRYHNVPQGEISQNQLTLFFRLA